jgi:hypothetical protein
MRGIKLDAYPRKGVIHAFQAPFVVQEHRKESNPRDESLMVDLGNSSSLEFVNS